MKTILLLMTLTCKITATTNNNDQVVDLPGELVTGYCIDKTNFIECSYFSNTTSPPKLISKEYFTTSSKTKNGNVILASNVSIMMLFSSERFSILTTNVLERGIMTKLCNGVWKIKKETL